MDIIKTYEAVVKAARSALYALQSEHDEDARREAIRHLEESLGTVDRWYASIGCAPAK